MADIVTSNETNVPEGFAVVVVDGTVDTQRNARPVFGGDVLGAKISVNALARTDV